MNPHFFTAPFYFAFIWFKVQGSRFRVQGSGFRWRLRRLFRGWYPRIVSLPLEGKVPRRGGWGTGGMKEDDESGKGRGTCGESVSHRPRTKKISCLRSK